VRICQCSSWLATEQVALAFASGAGNRRIGQVVRMVVPEMALLTPCPEVAIGIVGRIVVDVCRGQDDLDRVVGWLVVHQADPHPSVSVAHFAVGQDVELAAANDQGMVRCSAASRLGIQVNGHVI
jgi:hypothetical protein